MATATETPMTGETDPPFDLTTDVFFRMIEAGAFPSDCRVYLWDGRLREKMAKTAAHTVVQNALLGALYQRIPPGWFVGAENPIRLGEKHAPLPDLAVMRGRPLTFHDAGRYRYAEPREVGLVVEIAVSSLPKDLGERREWYARALVPVYWVADVRGRQVLAHEGPRVVDGRGEYARAVACGPGQSLSLVLGGQPIDPIPFEEIMA